MSEIAGADARPRRKIGDPDRYGRRRCDAGVRFVGARFVGVGLWAASAAILSALFEKTSRLKSLPQSFQQRPISS
jgi:hypothetical protein